jgi:hypothetical protein
MAAIIIVAGLMMLIFARTLRRWQGHLPGNRHDLTRQILNSGWYIVGTRITGALVFFLGLVILFQDTPI